MIIVENPYETKNRLQLKGNFHTHTTRSDGMLSPQEVINRYSELGYDFLSFSDHDVLAGEKDYQLFNNNGLVLIPGVEISANGPHLLYIDSEKEIQVNQKRQEILNEIQEISKKTGRGFAIVNHPDWENQFDHCSIEQLREWVGFLGIEIYNGVIGRLDGSQYSLNKWDILLSEGKKIWGFANDDSHRPPDIGLGWNIVFAKEKTKNSIIDEIIKGNFYCSTGVVIKNIECDGKKIYVETENAKKIAGIQNTGKRFSVVYSNSIEVDIPVDAKYVRFECWAEAEQMAWTQPFFILNKQIPVETEYISQWLVSDLLDIENLDFTSFSDALKQSKKKIFCHPSGTALAGFVDLREISNMQAGIIYAVADISFEKPTKAIISLGYDGPIKLWFNGKELFYGPGKNPAIRDQTKIYATAKKGNNQIAIAFDTNNGKGWGFFCKIIPVD